MKKSILVGLVLCCFAGCRNSRSLSTDVAGDRERAHVIIDNYIKESREKGIFRMTILAEFTYVNTKFLFVSMSNGDSLLVDHLVLRKKNGDLVSQSRIEIKPEDKEIIHSIFSDAFKRLSIPRSCDDGIDHHYLIEFTQINEGQRYDNLFQSSCRSYIDKKAEMYQPLIKMFEYNESILFRK